MWAADNWKEYELLDASDGERLERWGKYILVRPDPQVIWRGMKKHAAWKKADAVYSRSKSGGGSWSQSRLPEEWRVGFPLGEDGAQFIIRGVRSAIDFEYERNIADINRMLTGIDTLLLISEPQYAAISSSMVRELAHFGKDVSSYLP